MKDYASNETGIQSVRVNCLITVSYKAYVRKRKRSGRRQTELPSARTLGLVGNCNCEPVGVTAYRERIEIIGEIRDSNHEIVFQTDSHFECCTGTISQWPISYFWLAARRRYRKVPLQVRLEKKFQAAARRLLKKLSAAVPYPDPTEYFAVLQSIGRHSKPYCPKEARRRAKERKKEIEQQVDHFITRAKRNAREKFLPDCFRELNFDQMPTLVELKEHWKKLAIKHHPDLNGKSSDSFKRLRIAFEKALAFYE